MKKYIVYFVDGEVEIKTTTPLPTDFEGVWRPEDEQGFICLFNLKQVQYIGEEKL